VLDIHTPAQQPLSYDEQRFWITYNGELSNQKELRQELKKLHHSFNSKSDTEVVIAAFKEWGIECFSRFNGTWAMAIFDTEARTITLARDRYGIKPLYYSLPRGKLAFASEIKALLALPDIRPRMERERVLEFLLQIPGDGRKSFFTHIHEFPAAHYATISIDAPGTLKPEAYWHPSSTIADISEEEAGRQFRDLFFAVMEDQMQNRRDVGVSVSGGVASTAIAMAMRELMGTNTILHSFSAIFEEPGNDERNFVSATNSASHSIANWVTPSADDFMYELDTLLWHQEAPFATPGMYGQWCVMRAAREGQTPVLFDGFAAHDLLGTPVPRPVQSGWQKLSSSMQSSHRNDRKALRRLVPALKETVPPDDTTPPMASQLHQMDRSAMAFSVEPRLPFLDHRLADFCQALPEHLKPQRRSGALLLRKSLEDMLPDMIVHREEVAGYAAPLNYWMKSTLLPAFLRDIKQSRMPVVPLVDGGALREIVTRQMENFHPALAPLLFRIFILNRWMVRFHTHASI
jgi:asparagine synthase (glutamine-hydrolysing)